MVRSADPTKSNTLARAQDYLGLSFVFPRYPVKNAPQFRAARGMNRSDMRDFSGNMSAKIGMTVAILRCRAVADAVGQNRLEAVKLGPADVRSDVDNDAGDMLTNAGSHHPRLAVIQRKAFFMSDNSDKRLDALPRACQVCVSRECQVVGIACVNGAGGRCDSEQSSIKPPGSKIRQRRRCRRALRQVAGDEPLTCGKVRADAAAGARVPDIGGN